MLNGTLGFPLKAVVLTPDATGRRFQNVWHHVFLTRFIGNLLIIQVYSNQIQIVDTKRIVTKQFHKK